MAKRILVVDDDKNIGQILHASLSAQGFEVFISRNGEDAVKQFQTSKPDLVLLDILLPKMNGWDVCKSIKNSAAGKTTPVVLMSAVYKTPKMQRDAREKFHSDQFVEKPFQLSRLLGIVTDFLGKPDPADIPAAEGEIAAPTDDEATDVVDDAIFETDAAETAEEAESAPAGEGEEAPDEPESDALMEGELTTVSFAELLHDLYVMGQTGRMEMRNGGKTKIIDVADGYPVSIQTNVEEEYFGNFLVRMNLIEADQRDESLRRMKESGRLQGTCLIEMGVLSPQQVVNYLKLQIREKLFEIFSWPAGSYRFVADPTVQGDIQNVDMSVANIIQEGVRTHYDFERLERLMAGYWEQYLQLGTDRRYRFQDLKLTPQEAKIHESIDGTRTFEDVVTASPLPRERTLQVLYTLILSGMVEPILESRAAPQTVFYSPQEAQRVRELIDADGEGTAAPAEAGAGWAEESDDEMFGEEDAPTPTPHPSMIATPPIEDDFGDDVELRKRVVAMYERLADENLFHLLGVGGNPTEQEIRIAYHRLAKEFHPDRFFGRAGRDVKSKVEEIFRSINDAYDRLNTQEKINLYQKYLEGAELDDESKNRIEGVKKVILAEQRYNAGLQYLKEKRYTRAAASLRQALEVSPNEAEYVAHYGWALYNIPNEKDADQEELAMRPKESMADMQFEAREAMTRALEINPRTEKAYLFLGAIYKDQGLNDFAEKQYEKALLCNPNSIEALRELRLIKLRELQASKKKKSFFEKLLKR